MHSSFISASYLIRAEHYRKNNNKVLLRFYTDPSGCTHSEIIDVLLALKCHMDGLFLFAADLHCF